MVTRKAHKVVSVPTLPNCDFCGDEAHYDGKTRLGPWAYMCNECLRIHGLGLGLGVGQELIVEKRGESK